jgi:hypothetical protein
MRRIASDQKGEKMKQKTRPCKPGDVLFHAARPSGAVLQIKVASPAPHPESGTTKNSDVRLLASLLLPAFCGYLRHEWRDTTTVMGKTLGQSWGRR